MIKSASKLGAAAAALGLLLLQAPGLAEEAAAPAAKPKPAYIGAAGCKTCHKSEKKGNQFGQWEASRHAKAYATLATPAAKEIAKKKGIADPQKDGKCLKCHVTAHGVDPSLIAAPKKGKKGFQIEDGVQCESCHGPGSLYKKRSVMKDRKAAVAVGLIIPDEKTCKQCHNEESPTFKSFKYEEMVAKIAHPYPKGAAGEGEEE